MTNKVFDNNENADNSTSIVDSSAIEDDGGIQSTADDYPSDEFNDDEFDDFDENYDDDDEDDFYDNYPSLFSRALAVTAFVGLIILSVLMTGISMVKKDQQIEYLQTMISEYSAELSSRDEEIARLKIELEAAGIVANVDSSFDEINYEDGMTIEEVLMHEEKYAMLIFSEQITQYATEIATRTELLERLYTAYNAEQDSEQKDLIGTLIGHYQDEIRILEEEKAEWETMYAELQELYDAIGTGEFEDIYFENLFDDFLEEPGQTL